MFLKTLLLLVFSSTAMAADFSILSWNLYMLPKPIKFSQQSHRTKIIPRQLQTNNSDIMFFQEAFTSGIRNEIRNVLQKNYPYSYYLGRNLKRRQVLGSGVFIVSRRPFRVLDLVYFNRCASADCFASKGAVLIETTSVSGKIVQFVNTHMQAIEEYGAIRIHQLRQIRQMMNNHIRPGIPQILVGDLNIDSHEREFSEGQNIMKMNYTELEGAERQTSRVTVCRHDKTQKDEWIDHVWVDKNYHVEHSMEVKVFDFEYKGLNCPSSDHHAIAANLSFT